MSTEIQRQAAHERAEQIRLGLQNTAFLYAQAVTEEDWKALGYSSIKGWNMGEFGPDRFSTERRKEIHALLTARGLTTRAIAAATGTTAMTVSRDQREAGVTNVTQTSPRQEAARQREADKENPVVTRMRNRQLGTDEMEEIIRESLGWREIVKRYGIKQAAAQNARTRAMATAEERARVAGQPVPKTGNWNGATKTGRLRELKAARGQTESASFLELMKVQEIIVKLASVLQGIDVAGWPVDEVSLWAVSDLLDDLIGLGTWTDRAVSAVQGWLGDTDVRTRIAQLRNVTGRTDAEKEAFLARAAKLERQLELRLSSKAS